MELLVKEKIKEVKTDFAMQLELAQMMGYKEAFPWTILDEAIYINGLARGLLAMTHGWLEPKQY